MKFREMKHGWKIMFFLCVLCASVVNAFSLDREAFSIARYDLNLRVEPDQHRLGVRGKITLRNDSAAPQKTAILQISSSLDWRSIKAGDQPLQVITEPYTSDIDHTGSLSEAIVTLPQAVPPKGMIELTIGYEGVIVLDATRLTRIGTPDEAAHNADWDQIDTSFIAVRGAGYVAWYPIATESANLSEGNELAEVLQRWKAREADSRMQLNLSLSTNTDERPPTLLLNNPTCRGFSEGISRAQELSAECTFQSLDSIAPFFVIANYGLVERPTMIVHNLAGHAAAAEAYADAAEGVLPLVTDWFGTPHERAQTADLPDDNDAPFESGSLLLMPLGGSDSKLPGLAAAHQLTHASFISFRPWIEEGLAHFAQALYLEQQKGRQAALDYMGLHRSALSQIDPQTTVPRSEDEVNHSLVSTTSEELYRSKAMCVWWMLRDMLGDAALKKALAAYHPAQDKEPSYMPKLVSKQTPRDLEWFFDDWVYRDRGLPDFKVVSAFSRTTMTKTYMVTITIENQGNAGAEVPVIVKFATGQVIRRLEVRAKSKASIRVETPAAAQEIQVNDGSVPESRVTNNTFKVEPPQA